MNLEKYISTLLYSHDCVIVPEFGAFLAHKNSAQVVGNQVLPPSKKLGFNPSLYKSDGLLIQTVARLENINPIQAQTQIEECVNFWKNHLNKNNSLILDQIGTLSIDSEGKTNFEPTTKNYLTQSFGLQAIRPALILEQSLPAQESNSGVWWKVASLVPVILGGYLYFAKPQPVADYVNQQWSGFVLPLINGTEQTPKTALVSKESVNHPIIKAIDEKSMTEETQEISSEVTAQTEISTETTVKAHQVIAGSFRLLTEAEAMEAKLKAQGFDKAQFTQKKGSYFYVAYQTFDTKEEAMEYRRSIQNEYPDAWILSVE